MQVNIINMFVKFDIKTKTRNSQQSDKVVDENRGQSHIREDFNEVKEGQKLSIAYYALFQSNKLGYVVLSH